MVAGTAAPAHARLGAGGGKHPETGGLDAGGRLHHRRAGVGYVRPAGAGMDALRAPMAGKAGYDIKDCIVFEDVLSAAMGAKSGGFTVVAVYDEASSDDWDLICDVADYNIKNYSELMR